MGRYLRTTGLLVLALLSGYISQAKLPVAFSQEVARPNVLIILTDDQPESMLDAMPKAQSELAAKGLTFENAFVTTPLCCPSRATFLTGQYAHNHGVVRNVPPHGGAPKFKGNGSESETVAVALDAPYKTAYVGKYLNSMDGKRVPPGWDRWFALSGPGYKDGGSYEVNADGTVKTYRKDSTDLFAEKAEGFIKQGARQAKPWFAVVATYDPHAPFPTAKRNRHVYDDMALPRPPSFGEADVSDKPGWIRNKSGISESEQGNLRSANEKRAESLRDVDDLVGRLSAALRETGQSERTYVIFTSDNGLLRGEHRLTGKSVPYEESVGVPLLVRGPGVEEGSRTQLVANNDIAPTVAALTGASLPKADGRSLEPLFSSAQATSSDTPWRDALLLEYRRADDSDPPPSWNAVRTEDRTYVEYATGEKELYDLRADPYQLENLLHNPTPEAEAKAAELSGRLSALKNCAQKTCRATEDVP